VAIGISANGMRTVYVDREFYGIAQPLTPLRYKEFSENRPVMLVDKSGKFRAVPLSIDQVYGERLQEAQI
jgi:hypothetical protein